jgi:hypothetical protein
VIREFQLPTFPISNLLNFPLCLCDLVVSELEMTTNSKIWVSQLNALPEIRTAFPKTKIHFYDTTLRDGEQTVGVVLSPQQKLQIARQLDELGVTRIEAGFPRVSPEDAEAIQLMQKANLKAELWGFSRAINADVEELVRLGLRASVIEARPATSS